MDGDWTILFSHPADLTPVCTTELARAAQLQFELTKRNVKICALSVDSVKHDLEWIQDIEQINRTSVRYTRRRCSSACRALDGKTAGLQLLDDRDEN